TPGTRIFSIEGPCAATNAALPRPGILQPVWMKSGREFETVSKHSPPVPANLRPGTPEPGTQTRGRASRRQAPAERIPARSRRDYGAMDAGSDFLRLARPGHGGAPGEARLSDAAY